ncbi:hypothetical protein B0H13DRAFT_2276972 [Mycena leptocephala]|nr:hypothetical protein B0H13DRAFT_2276972 [Mycena leptocephala]
MRWRGGVQSPSSQFRCSKGQGGGAWIAGGDGTCRQLHRIRGQKEDRRIARVSAAPGASPTAAVLRCEWMDVCDPYEPCDAGAPTTARWARGGGRERRVQWGSTAEVRQQAGMRRRVWGDEGEEGREGGSGDGGQDREERIPGGLGRGGGNGGTGKQNGSRRNKGPKRKLQNARNGQSYCDDAATGERAKVEGMKMAPALLLLVPVPVLKWLSPRPHATRASAPANTTACSTPTRRSGPATAAGSRCSCDFECGCGCADLAFAATKKGGGRDASGGGVDWGKEKCRFGGRVHRGTLTAVCAGRSAGRPYIVVLIVVGVVAALVEMSSSSTALVADARWFTSADVDAAVEDAAGGGRSSGRVWSGRAGRGTEGNADAANTHEKKGLGYGHHFECQPAEPERTKVIELVWQNELAAESFHESAGFQKHTGQSKILTQVKIKLMDSFVTKLQPK